ncbi:hypothetical protein BCR39DRAFT_531076 [Naematelia encephala]|uniref:Uncharacterized protein n=1 Tax=Naematelia encephala TaxID=71784 RepID=A0A1Y2B4N5_9TREE|nr:hypothetical protein BCR39DRAFT_531076 [Naematelia encephala]
MAILSSRPSRSYADVDHDANGLSPVGALPYGTRKIEGGFKTYRPPLVETHLKRSQLYDPNPTSHFAPLPPAFDLSRKHKKEVVKAGQKAELDHILQPGFRSASSMGQTDVDGDSTSLSGPSRSNGTRTAGGVDRQSRKTTGQSLRPSASVQSFRANGVYVDSNGTLHDTEYDPFKGVTDMSRQKSRRRSAFGQDRRRSSESSSSSDAGSQEEIVDRRKSTDTTGGNARDEEEMREKLEMERRRLDEVSGLAAARRRSIMSTRTGDGRSTPSLRSAEDALSLHDKFAGRSRSSQGHYVHSPLSPTFGPPLSATSYMSARTLPTTSEGGDESPKKSTETTQPPPALKMQPPPAPVHHKKSTETTQSHHHSQKTTIGPDKKITITGFDAPVSPMPKPQTPSVTAKSSEENHNRKLKVPSPGSVKFAGASSISRASSELTREPSTYSKPAERPREELFPETPAQKKKREERERRSGLSIPSSRVGSITIDTPIRTRVLPEIEIVEDDDPRVIIPEHGPSTRVQTKHDHVIRGPFSLALNAQSEGQRRASIDARSLTGGPTRSVSTVLEEGQGGYLPSRWASGDKNLRRTEDEKDKYRPREWNGQHPASEEWKPTLKDEIKRNWKDLATNARFSMFRAKKKLSRKTEF